MKLRRRSVPTESSHELYVLRSFYFTSYVLDGLRRHGAAAPQLAKQAPLVNKFELNKFELKLRLSRYFIKGSQ